MTKKVVSFVMFLAMSLSIMAQAVQETVVNIGALTIPAVTITLDKDVKVVQDAMKYRLKDAQLRTKSVEGYQAAMEQVFSEISATPINFYAKVEELGRKKNKATVVTICAVPNDLTVDQASINGALRAFLEGFPQYIGRYEARLSMQAEQENLKKAEKNVASAEANVASLEKSINNSQNKISDKQKEIEKLKAKIKDCEDDIIKLQNSIRDDRSKKVDAEKKVEEAKAAAKKVEAEVERYRQMAQ